MVKKLSRRERYSIYGVCGIVCLFVLVRLIIFPTVDKRHRLRRALQVKTKILEEMVALKSEYDLISTEADMSKVRFANRKKGFTLFSFLDRLSGEAGIKNNITYMKPSTSVQKNSPYKISLVEMKIQGLTLEQLAVYLHMIETSENMVNIKRLSISKKTKQEGFIDAVLQVETFEI
jgi:general secretion pathway protein M